MSTETLQRPQDTEADHEPGHLVWTHHAKVAMCGADISDARVVMPLDEAPPV